MVDLGSTTVFQALHLLAWKGIVKGEGEDTDLRKTEPSTRWDAVESGEDRGGTSQTSCSRNGFNPRVPTTTSRPRKYLQGCSVHLE